MVDFTSAKIVMQGRDGLFLNELKVRPSSALRIYASTGDVHVTLGSMPQDIQAHFKMHLSVGFRHPVPELRVTVKAIALPNETFVMEATVSGIYLRAVLRGGEEVTLSGILGATISFAVRGAVEVTMQYIVDGTHFVTSTAVGAWAEFQADLDGAAEYAGERFFHLVGATAGATTSTIRTVGRWGQNGVAFTIETADTVGTVLVGAAKDVGTGITMFRDGAVGASKASFEFLVDGVRYRSLHDLW